MFHIKIALLHAVSSSSFFVFFFFFFFTVVAGLVLSIDAIGLFNESWAWVEPLLGALFGDLENSHTVGIEPVTSLKTEI